MKTIYVKSEDTDRKWYIIDAQDKVLGRLAQRVADVIRGKHKPSFHPSAECGDFVIVINAGKIKVTGKKSTDKTYFWHTGFVGGIKSITFDKLLAKDATQVIMKAVKGMVPHNRLGRKLMSNVKVYVDDKHPHAAQQPLPLEI